MKKEYSYKGKNLRFEGEEIEPSIRTFGQMRPVLAFPEKEKGSGLSDDTPLYYMYRKVLSFGVIRYDITRVASANLCGERNKTFGHSHPVADSGVAWPEIYEVLEGEAHFIIQKADGAKVSEARFLTAKKGDCFLIPPGFGHVSINPGKKDLVLANLVSGEFESDYRMYEKLRGTCYYETTKGEIVKNPRYEGQTALEKGNTSEFSAQFECFAPFDGANLLEAAKDYKNLL